MRQLKEGEDYYIDTSGLYVFTEKYHLNRGICCGNACRHCPFEYLNVPEPLRTKLLDAKKQDKEQ
jgi:hypothetical protein